MSQSEHSLKQSQQRTLDAWNIALEKINLEQLPEALQENIEIIQRELSQNNYQSLEKIPDIVKQDIDLKQVYSAARQELRKEYVSQERTKSAATIEEVSTFSFPNAEPVEKTKSKLNRKALLILQELDNYPLTLEDLKYRLDLPSWEVHKIMKQLWNERKIDKVSGNIWYSVFPITKRKEFDVDNDDSNIAFLLTSLGKFHLHSVVKSR